MSLWSRIVSFFARGQQEPDVFLCSSCWQAFDLSLLHVVPHEGAGAGVQVCGLQRCDSCWRRSYEETMELIDNWNAELRDAFVSFFEIWHMKGLAEEVKHSSLEASRTLVRRFMAELIKDDCTTLSLSLREAVARDRREHG